MSTAHQGAKSSSNVERMLHCCLTRRQFLGRFDSNAGPHSFVAHIMCSSRLVRAGVVLAVLVDLATPRFLSDLSFIAAIRRLLAASMELHRSATNSVLTKRASPPTVQLGSQKGRLDGLPSVDCDVVVVGSGPGGAIAAFHAAQAGMQVIIVESGHFPSNSASHSTDQLMADYQSGGQELILGRPIVPFAQGAVVGGGSEVNSGLYHRLPTHLQPHWLYAMGSTVEEWRAAVKDVESRLPIERQDAASLGQYTTSPIPLIAENLGWEHAVIPRWRSYHEGGFEHYGMGATYLRNALDAGATLMKGEEVQAVSLEQLDSSVTVTTKKRRLRASHVVIAAGTTGTPGLLMRSGLASVRKVRFGYHAMAKVAVNYPYAINDLVDIDPHQAWLPGDVAKLGVAASTPDLLRSALAGLGLATDLVSPHLGVFYVSLPAAGRGGIVRIGHDLQPWFFAHSRNVHRLDQLAESLESAVRNTGGTVLAPGRRTLSTVHVFGSLPLGTSQCVDLNGVVVGTNGRVRVSDASLLPTAPGVNPQGPLMHLATVLAKRALQRS